LVGLYKIVVEKVFPTFTIKSFMAGSNKKIGFFSTRKWQLTKNLRRIPGDESTLEWAKSVPE
jgi:hypothetical protein